MNETPLTKSYPSSSQIGFSVITTTREFHLFAPTEGVRAEFLYALACLRTIPERPSLEDSYQRYMKSLGLEPTKDNPIVPAEQFSVVKPPAPAIPEPQPRSENVPPAVVSDKAPEQSEPQKTEPMREERASSITSTAETVKPLEISPASVEPATAKTEASVERVTAFVADHQAELKNTVVAVVQPEPSKTEEKKKEDSNLNVPPAPSETVTMVPKRTIPAEKVPSAARAKAEVKLIDCVSATTVQSRPIAAPAQRRNQQPEVVRIERNAPRLSKGATSVHPVATSNPFECGDHCHRIGKGSAAAAPAVNLADDNAVFLKLFEREEQDKENLKNENKKRRPREEAKTELKQTTRGTTKERSIKAKMDDTFEYDWDEERTAHKAPAHHACTRSQAPACVMKTENPPAQRREPGTTKAKAVTVAAGAGRKGEQFEEAW